MSQILAKNRVKKRCSKGISIKLFVANRTRSFDSDNNDISVNIKSFPIRYAPFDRKTLERVNFSEDVDVLVYVPYDVLLSKGYNINLYREVEIMNKRYKIYKTEPYSQHDNTFLYYIIGGRKVS